MPRLRVNCHVCVDLDGTIMPRDRTDGLLQRFTLLAWLDRQAPRRQAAARDNADSEAAGANTPGD